MAIKPKVFSIWSFTEKKSVNPWTRVYNKYFNSWKNINDEINYIETMATYVENKIKLDPKDQPQFQITKNIVIQILKQ